jgi:hypothetical protein
MTINVSDKTIETLLMALDTALYFEQEYPESGEKELVEGQQRKIADMKEAQEALTELRRVPTTTIKQSMNPIELILDINYPHVRKELGEYQFRRYVNVLATRAVEFYIDHELDVQIVAEDLYEGGGKYPNLDYSEEQTVKWVESLQKLAGQL